MMECQFLQLWVDLLAARADGRTAILANFDAFEKSAREDKNGNFADMAVTAKWIADSVRVGKAAKVNESELYQPREARLFLAAMGIRFEP